MENRFQKKKLISFPVHNLIDFSPPIFSLTFTCTFTNAPHISVNGFSIKFSYEFSQLVYYLRDPSVATLFCLHLFMYSIIFIMCAYRKGIVLSNKQTGHGTDLKDLTDFLEVRVFFLV